MTQGGLTFSSFSHGPPRPKDELKRRLMASRDLEQPSVGEIRESIPMHTCCMQGGKFETRADIVRIGWLS